MTQKDYVKAELDLFKIMLTGFLGTIFGLGLFDFQTKGAYSFGVWVGIGFFLILFFIFAREYRKSMEELKDLP